MCEEENNTTVKDEDLLSTYNEEVNRNLYSDRRPVWLRKFANEKWFVCVYSIVVATDFMQSSYFFGTLSTIEKNFHLSATMLGILKSTFELGYLTMSISLAYFIGKGNKIRWISGALLINGIFCLVRIVPHIIDTETSREKQRNKDTSLTQYALYLFIVAQVVTGSCKAVIKNSGYIYLDHNTRKNTFPLLFAIVAAIGDSGRFLGYMISYFTLRIHVYPSESPNYTDKSYQWIGAWWLGRFNVRKGWIPISSSLYILSMIVLIFPRSLPKTESKRMNQVHNKSSKVSVSDFYSSCKRILGNKIATLDILAEISFKVAFSGYEIFLPKYLESQYGLTASLSSLSLAILKLFEKPTSMILSGFSIFKFKPKPRSLMKYNVIMGAIQIGVITSFIFISCPQEKIQGNWTRGNSLNLTTKCNILHGCSENIKYSPVCNVRHKLLFYSSCHAGCFPESKNQNMKIHDNCSCVPDFESVTEGLCPTDCKLAVVVFLIINAVFTSFIYAPIRFSKKILRFRIVQEEDKSLHYGIRKFLPSIFALLSSIIYGSMIDQACLIFDNNNNSGKGYCLMYNLTKLRYSMNFFAIGGVFICVILEMFLWYYIKSIKMYEEDHQMNSFQTVDRESKITEAFIQK